MSNLLSMSLDIWSIIILIFISQGAFNIFAIFSKIQKPNQKARLFMISMIVFVIWMLLEFLSVRNRIVIPINAFYGTRYGAWLVLGPITYFYFRSMTSNTEFRYRDLIHFIPFILFAILIPLGIDQELSHRQVHYGMLSVFDHRPKQVTPFEYLYSTIFYLQFFHLLLYLIYNHFHIERYKEYLKQQYSTLGQYKWMRLFNILLIFSLSLSCIYLYILFYSDVYSRSLDYIYVIPFGVLIYSIGFYLIKIDWPKVIPLQKTRTQIASESDLNDWEYRLKRIMENEEPYLDFELRVKDLAEKCGISNHEMSYLLNNRIGMSFFDFINKYRINRIKSLITSSNGHTLMELAYDAGFNNKTSFVNAFKKFEGCTPSQFKKKINQH